MDNNQELNDITVFKFLVKADSKQLVYKKIKEIAFKENNDSKIDSILHELTKNSYRFSNKFLINDIAIENLFQEILSNDTYKNILLSKLDTFFYVDEDYFHYNKDISIKYLSDLKIRNSLYYFIINPYRNLFNEKIKNVNFNNYNGIFLFKTKLKFSYK